MFYFKLNNILKFGLIDKNDAKNLGDDDKYWYLHKSKVMNKKNAFIAIVQLLRKMAKLRGYKGINAMDVASNL